MPSLPPVCRVLLVEDNPDDEQITLRALRRAEGELTIEVVRDGAEAVEVLSGLLEKQSPPDLVLLDLKLPKLGGVEVLEEIRGMPGGAELNVVAFTSSDEASDIEDCYTLGVSDYVRKPVDFDEYIEAVAVIVRKCFDAGTAA